ncbi:hypothetical protein VIGAN_04110700, partial [Vigna angularis var. angularis]
LVFIYASDLIFKIILFENTFQISFLHSPSQYTHTICVSLPLPFLFVSPAAQRHIVSLGFPCPFHSRTQRSSHCSHAKSHGAHKQIFFPNT